jgi:hypothetical protein
MIHRDRPSAFAPTRAQAAIISLAQRSRLKRGALSPMLSRLVNLVRAGPVDVQYQGASFRFYHKASATERGALFNPDYNLEELSRRQPYRVRRTLGQRHQGALVAAAAHSRRRPRETHNPPPARARRDTFPFSLRHLGKRGVRGPSATSWTSPETTAASP